MIEPRGLMKFARVLSACKDYEAAFACFLSAGEGVIVLINACTCCIGCWLLKITSFISLEQGQYVRGVLL